METQIFQFLAWSDKRFPRYDPFNFGDFGQKGRGRHYSNDPGSVTNWSIFLKLVFLERYPKDSKYEIIVLLQVMWRMVIFRPLLWPWIWLCGSRDLETTLHGKFSSTCFLHNIKKLEVYYFSLACNIKSNFTYMRLKRMLIVHRPILHVCTQLFTFISTWQWRIQECEKGGAQVWPNLMQLGALQAPQRGPGRSPGGKRILATIYWKLVENQVSGLGRRLPVHP